MDAALGIVGQHSNLLACWYVSGSGCLCMILDCFFWFWRCCDWESVHCFTEIV